MKRATLLVSAYLVVFGFAGCGGGSTEREPEPKRLATGTFAEPPAATPPSPAAEAAAPMIVDGYQVVRIIVRNTGYEPDRIQLAAGTPVKVVFVQEATSHCASQIQIPAFGVPVTDLPQGRETIVEFTPDKAGTFTFACGMDMMRGTILVAS